MSHYKEYLNRLNMTTLQYSNASAIRKTEECFEFRDRAMLIEAWLQKL